MKKFNAEMKVVRFGAEDMIVTSGKFLTLSGVGDGIENNNSMEFGGETYSRQTCNIKTIHKNLSDYFDSSLSKNYNDVKFYINGSESETLTRVWGGDYANGSYNGTYTYDANRGFVKKQ